MIEFKSWHLELSGFAGLDAHRAATLCALGQNDLVRTIVTAGEQTVVLGVAAIVPIAAGIGEVVVVPSSIMPRFPTEFAKTVKAALQMALGEFGKIQAVGEDTKASRRWFKWLGFSQKGKRGKEILWQVPL